MPPYRTERPALFVDVPDVLGPSVHEARALAEQLQAEAASDAPLDRIFTPAFLAAHAGVDELGALLARAGLRPADGEVDRALLGALGTGTLDRIAREHTDFETWAELEHAAESSYVARRLVEFTL